MKNFKSLFLYYILIAFIFQFSLTDDEIHSFSPTEPYTDVFDNIQQEIDLKLILNKPDSSIYYLHFSTWPNTKQSLDLQQIIYSSEIEKPLIKDAESYSFKFSSKANLITLDPNKEDNTIYLTIRCLKYPCSFNFKAALEKDTPILYLDETHNFYGYNSNTFGKDKINQVKFYIPTMNNIVKTLMNIAVINPGDTDGTYNHLTYVEDGKENPIEKGVKISNGVIYTVEEKESYNNYFLEIESMENQFIIISIKTSSVINEENIETDLTPNTITKYSNLICKNKINECFKLNEDYINNYLKDSQKNDFLYASINFFSLPIKTYLKYSNSQTEINNDNNTNSINVLLTKESDEYPKICFEQDNTKLTNNTLMIEFSHMYENMDNIDISSPIFSGFFNTKTLLKNTLGIYTHYSDIHFIERISFYLKPIKGKPIMYFVQCNDYPKCINNINDLEKATENVFKAQDFGDFQFYSKQYEPKTKYKDLSPYGYTQNLLYVYCHEETIDDYCQFEILTYSDYEEININEKEDFNAVMKEDEKLMFKIMFKKGHYDINNINFCINATDDDITFDYLDDVNKALVTHYLQIKEDLNLNCYLYELDKKFHDLEKNDTEIIFNIISKKDIQIKLTNEINILYSNKIGEIIKINDLSFPYSLNYLINNIDTDYLFNLYLDDKNQKLNLEQIQIGAILINETYFKKIIVEGSKNILNDSIIEKIDPATRTVSLVIKKDYIKNIIGDDLNNKYYLHLVIENENKTVDYIVNAKMFLLEKQKNNYYPVEKNNFISDNLIIENPNIFNAYQFRMENNAFLEIKFSSNYPLDDKFMIYIAEYNNLNIDIDFLEQNKKEYEINSTGQMYTILYNNSQSTEVDIIFAIVSKREKDEIGLNKINYIFKYDLYKDNDEYNKKPKYYFNQNYTLKEEGGKHVFEFDSIKKDYMRLIPQIYIRKITPENEIKNETFDTFSKIESKYEIVIINSITTEDDGKIKVKVDKISEKKCTFSILIDIQDENEKFVIFNPEEQPEPEPTSSTEPEPTSSTEPEPTDPEPTDPEPTTTTEPDTTSSPDPTPSSSSETDPKQSGDKSLAVKIAVPIACVVFVIILVVIIITIRKRRRNPIQGTFQGDSEGLLKEELN